ncbi:MAG: FAD-dependent oxidoreductase [Bythopirellula sp.]
MLDKRALLGERTLLGQRAIVIGGGIAGLTSARVLSDYFDQVIVLDRDRVGSGVQPRSGVPQGKHVHILLARGEQVLTQLFPGMDADLERLGAVRLRIGYDVIAYEDGETWPRREFGIICHAQSRPLLEHCVRERVARIENIRIQSGSRVVHPLFTADSESVCGVVYHDESRVQNDLDADLVVDASGRFTRAPQWLEARGYPVPEESSVDVDVSYTTTQFDIPPTHSLPALGVAVRGLPSTFNRGGYLQTIEANRWIVTLTGRDEEEPPTDWPGFLAYAKSLQTPEIFRAIKDLKPVEKIQQYRFPTSLLRHYEQLSRFPARFLVLGDGICSINPIYAQGMSVAARQIEFLDRALQTMTEGGMGWENLASCFFAGAAEAVSSSWSQSCEADRAYSRTIPIRQVKKFARRRAYTATLRRIAKTDAEVHRRIVRVMNLMDPASVLTDDELSRRVMMALSAPPMQKAA